MAFGIAISGLNAASADLNVTGNNIANSNTTGFKESRAEFADLIATSAPGNSGSALGQGVQLTQIAQQFKQGTVGFTDNNLDLAISGEGFFALEQPSGSRVYSRAGAFGVDKNGFMVNGTGNRLLGFQAVSGSVTGAVGALKLSSANLNPKPTGKIDVGVNLDSSSATPPASPAFDPTVATTYNNSTSTTVFDSLGEQHLATLYFRKTAANTWESHLGIDNAPVGGAVPLAFSPTGALTSAMPVSYGSYTPPNGAAAMPINFDFGTSTQFGSGFGVNSLSQDGYTTGRLNGIDIDESGVVLARYTNGQSQKQGQVVLANFSNPQGLQPASDTSWAETNTSGTPLVGAPGTASLGLVQAGALEQSNTALAQQLVNMIIAQRNFQANAQMIRTEDAITQTVINLR